MSGYVFFFLSRRFCKQRAHDWNITSLDLRHHTVIRNGMHVQVSSFRYLLYLIHSVAGDVDDGDFVSVIMLYKPHLYLLLCCCCLCMPCVWLQTSGGGEWDHRHRGSPAGEAALRGELLAASAAHQGCPGERPGREEQLALHWPREVPGPAQDAAHVAARLQSG